MAKGYQGNLPSKKRNFSNHLIPVRMRRIIVQMVTA
jgi:hypothetical protein